MLLSPCAAGPTAGQESLRELSAPGFGTYTAGPLPSRGPALPYLKRGALARKGANHKPKGESRMLPTPSTPGPTGVTVLPPAGRDEMLAAAGLSTSHRWSEATRWGHGPDHDGLIVDEAVAWDDPDEAARELEGLGFLLDGGWNAVEPAKGSERGGGTTSHRGILHPDEYVDPEALRAELELTLGFSVDAVRSVYRQGGLSADQHELRARIDARLLGLSRRGGNMLALARLLGWAVKAATDNGGPRCRTLENALERAREAAGVTA